MGWSGGAIFVDEGLCGMEAKVEELTGGVEAVAGLGLFEEALLTSIRKRTIRRPSSVSSRTMSARDGGWASWFSVLANISSTIGTCIRGCQGTGDCVFICR